jgi:uncharacterized protein
MAWWYISWQCARSRCLAGLFAAGLLASWAPVAAQVAPSAAEVAGYTGLLASAHTGDAAALSALLAQGQRVDARDANGRTPLHVATFARQRGAVRQLAAAGANLGALDNDRYDAAIVTAS